MIDRIVWASQIVFCMLVWDMFLSSTFRYFGKSKERGPVEEDHISVAASMLRFVVGSGLWLRALYPVQDRNL